MPHRARETMLDASLPGLIRQSIFFERLLRRVMDTRVKPAYDASVCCGVLLNSDSKIQTAKRSRTRAARVGLLSFSPPDNEGRRDAERRPLGQRPRLDSRIAGKQRHTATPLDVPPRRSFSLGPLFEGTGGKPTAHRSRR